MFPETNSITQKYQSKGGYGGYPPGSQNRKSNGYPQPRFAPSGQYPHNKRYQNTGFSQSGKSPQNKGYSQGVKSSGNTGYSQNKVSDKKSGIPKGGTFPNYRSGHETYRSDHQTSYVPSANVIPHDMVNTFHILLYTCVLLF